MLIRFLVDNVFSFGEQKEFNMLPYSRLQTLSEHKYKILDFELLKMAAIYGANGAGKSNMIKGLQLLQAFVLTENQPKAFRHSQFKFNKIARPQLFAVEFIQEGLAFYYGLEIDPKGRIIHEELYYSGLGQREDIPIYKRTTGADNKTQITFIPAFEQDEKSQLLKAILLEEFVQPEKPVLKLLSNRDNQYLRDIKLAFRWFEKSLRILSPKSDDAPGLLASLVHAFDVNHEIKDFAKELMCSFHIGISSLVAEKTDAKRFFGLDDEIIVENIKKKLELSDKSQIVYRNQRGDEVLVEKENGEIWVKQLKVGHTIIGQPEVLFDLDAESDGTLRLLEFIPIFKNVLNSSVVVLIDEIERSIHPLLIKELIKKFSEDIESKGQLIFTTHESQLLDQDIFRSDEIWFAEKKPTGCTDLYSLSDYKPHKTIDIQKGYLTGRYGAIPFLGNLKELNWHTNDTH
jgi:AAA15 family ATPase/GTPase